MKRVNICASIMVLTFIFSYTAVLYAESQTIPGKDGAEMVLIPGGDFTMGSEEPALAATAAPFKVYVNSFYMDKYEVTNELFAKFLNSIRPSEKERLAWIVLRSDLDIEARTNWWPTEIIYENGEHKAFKGYERHPAISVSWFAADAYCKWAGKRLPTEAEWEKAARGGLNGKLFPWGNEIPTGDVIFGRLWMDNQRPAPTEPVENYLPNGYGLYNIAGNVWEWCSDWYSPNYYDKAPDKNPKGPDKGETKVLRGGSWFNSALALRVAFRNSENPYNSDDGVGFRCAMDVPK